MNEWILKKSDKEKSQAKDGLTLGRWIQSQLDSGRIKRLEIVAAKEIPVKRDAQKLPAYDADSRARIERRRAWLRDTKLFMWDWVGGGYNSCRAVDAANALQKAQKMGKGRDGRITLVPRNIRETTGSELEAISFLSR